MPTPMKMPTPKEDFVDLKGGLDQVTPVLAAPPGIVRGGYNFECGINGGYTRVAGYERYDGRTSPSSVTFKLLPILSFLSVPTVGQTVTGGASGTTAQIVAVSTATGFLFLAVTKLLGAGFQQDELLNVSGTVIGKIGPQTIRLTKREKKQYRAAAANVYRALIQAVPGTGPVRGVFGATFNGAFAVYAIRDESLAFNRAQMHKATAQGWVPVHGINASPLSVVLLEYNFKNGGPVPIADNTPGPSPYYGTARRVVLTGGSWAANTATGKMVYQHEGFGLPNVGIPLLFGQTSILLLQYNEQGGGNATQGPSSTTFRTGGAYEFDIVNFAGGETTRKVYGCNRSSRAWEYDGEYVIPIDCGLPAVATTPNALLASHIRGHHNHLMVAVGSSILFSGVGGPHDFSASAGGGEIATGDAVTGFLPLPGNQQSGALAVLCRNHTKILYGTALGGPEPFDLVDFETETGAIPGSLQRLDRVYYLDDRGVIDLQTAQEYGNFVSSTLTRYVQKFMELKRGRFRCSIVNRTKSQLRLYFNDRTGLGLTLDNGKLKGMLPIAFAHGMQCAWSGEDAIGSEVLLSGGDDGYVYQMERGTSFDGQAINARLLLNWNSMKSPRLRKALHRASVELQDGDYAELQFGVRLGPERGAHVQDEADDATTETELSPQWDHFTWDAFQFDGAVLSPEELDVKGTAERVQYLIESATDYLDPFTLTGINTHYFPRRGLR